MKQIIRASQRHSRSLEGLQTHWLFSFSDYHDPNNVNFGRLRVFNDDVVAPQGGFPTHPHRDMEIVTLVLSGEITHQDSTGREQKVGAGGVQVMTAGSGLNHSEYNLADEPLYLYQIWIFPDSKGLPPAYRQKQFDPSWTANRLAPLASGQGKPGAVPIQADATLYRGVLDAGKEIRHAATPGRKLFVYVTSGEVALDGEVLQAKDQARFEADGSAVFQARGTVDLVLIDVAA